MKPVVDDTDQQDDSVAKTGGRAKPNAWLRIFAESPAGTAFPIPARGATLGRATAASTDDIQIDDGLMSRAHARVAYEGATWRFTDLRSRNGSFVDGLALAPGRWAAIAHGSVVRLGDTVGVFHIDDPGADSEAEVAFFPGVSSAARQVRVRVRALSDAAGHVLVLGETGTGKERVARRIGAAAPQFVPVNCAELHRELARSELFGHVKGAFSGAVAREGLVDLTRNGVLFLDEIGEIPLDVQGELLRFLEDGSYRAVGGSELRSSRTRIVAATNVDLDDAARRGTFRRDLLARLRASNKPLQLPPLRERREDLPGWVDHFIREALPTAPTRPWSAGSLECLLLFGWPENLRELRGAVRGAIEEPREWPLQPSRLPPRVQDYRRGLRTTVVESGDVPDDDAPDDAPTREQIEAALARTGGNMRTTADLLGIHRRRLYRLCKALGIDHPQFRPGE